MRNLMGMLSWLALHCSRSFHSLRCSYKTPTQTILQTVHNLRNIFLWRSKMVKTSRFKATRFRKSTFLWSTRLINNSTLQRVKQHFILVSWPRLDEGNVFTSERMKGFAKLDLEICQVHSKHTLSWKDLPSWTWRSARYTLNTLSHSRICPAGPGDLQSNANPQTAVRYGKPTSFCRKFSKLFVN